MHAVNMLQAKSSLSRLVESIKQGGEREIVITRNGRGAVNLLLDTHIALWAITDSLRLPQKARDLIQSPMTTETPGSPSDETPGNANRVAYRSDAAHRY